MYAEHTSQAVSSVYTKNIMYYKNSFGGVLQQYKLRRNGEEKIIALLIYLYIQMQIIIQEKNTNTTLEHLFIGLIEQFISSILPFYDFAFLMSCSYYDLIYES